MDKDKKLETYSLESDQNDVKRVTEIYNKILDELVTDVINGSVVGNKIVRLTRFTDSCNSDETQQAMFLAKKYFESEGFPANVEFFSAQYEHGDCQQGYIIEINLWSNQPDFQP